MISGLIERRPWAVILAWIIIVALLAPYAAQIDNVVKTQTESFLPQNVESVKADKALQQLEEQYGSSSIGKADYLVLVHGVPVSLEAYYKLLPGYLELKNNTQGNITSWIDIIYTVEQQVRNATRQGLNGTVQAVGGMIAVNQAYNMTWRGVNSTLNLLVGLDTAYSNVYTGVENIAKSKSNLTRIETSYYAVCNKLTPAVAMTWYNVTRTEYLLENITTAYQNGLTQQDILAVVNASNLTAYGIGPIQPEIVVAVYNYTLTHGGPSNFNNTVAAQLATLLVEKSLEAQGANNQTIALASLAGKVWAQVVGKAPSFRAVMGRTNLVEGQIELLHLTTTLLPTARNASVKALENYYSGTLPEPASKLAVLIGENVAQTGCNATLAGQVLVEAVTQYLNMTGLPLNADLEALVSQALETGTVNKTLAARIAANLVVQKAASTGMASPDMLEAMVENMTPIILQADPAGMCVLCENRSLAIAYAAMTVLEQQGVKVNSTVWEELLRSATSVENETVTVLKIILKAQGRDQAIPLLMELAERDLLGEPNESLLAQAPSILAPKLAAKANITVDQARELVALAVKVYRGEITLDAAVENQTRSTLEKVFPKIIGEFKGMLVEKNLDGFIIAYTPPQTVDDVDQQVKMFLQLEDKVNATLRSAGYTGFQTLPGGNMFMTWEIRHAAMNDIKRSDRISMGLVIIILALVLESIAAVILPFIGIGMGLMASLAVAYFMAKAGIIDITTHSRTIMYTTGLGLGIDYAAYVSKRFREAAAQGLDSRAAARVAFEKSWKAVLAGATTAAIGFGSMLVARDFPFITSIGSNVPLTIIGVMLASITFIPALLAYVGEKGWFWWPRHPVETGIKPKEKSLSVKIVRPLASKPAIPLVIIVLIAVGAYAVMSGFQGSYDLTLNLPKDSLSAKSINYINKYYDPSVLYPLYIVVSDTSKTKQVADAVNSTGCVSKVYIPDQYKGHMIYVYMKVDPLSPQGVDCAQKIREEAHKIDPGSLVGGMSAINLDLKNLINRLFYHRVYPTAITLMFLTFLAAYGSVLMALSAVLGVALAAYAGAAATIVLYQDLLNTQVLWYLPVIVFTAILGVGMDYNSFSIARAREECMRDCSMEGLLEAARHSTPIVLGLATIMAGAYIGLAATKTPGLSEMGTALVIGVLLAGINAALLFTPPLVALFKDKAWWPMRTGRKRNG